MSQNNNSDLTREIIDIGKLQVGRDFVPNIISNQIVPVIDVNPKHSRRINLLKYVNSVTTGSMTAYTTPIGKDFYLTNMQFSMTKDAACDTATGAYSITAVVDGVTIRLGMYPIVTLKEDTLVINMVFPFPIKLDQNTSIATSQAFAAGLCARTLCIFGYLVDNPNA